MTAVPRLDLRGDPVALTEALVDVPSVSGEEGPLADAVEAALRDQAPHLAVARDGDAVVARTDLGRPTRVLLAGHLDTVPIAGNVPGRREGPLLHGCGSTDMKGGDAVALHLAAALDPGALAHDLTVVLYDQEEVEAARNGLGRLQRHHPGWLAADLAVLLEPTQGAVEAGCQGTLRVVVRTRGRRAHTARAWVGANAVHALAPVLERLAAYRPREVELDGCTYREGLQAVRVSGGVSGNVVPDAAELVVNHRFAPDRSEAEALAHVEEVLGGPGVEVALADSAPGAPPGLGAPLARALVAATGRPAVAKLGWTDVSRFAAAGVPAVNLGPGDPLVAHTVDELLDTQQVTEVTATLSRFLTA